MHERVAVKVLSLARPWAQLVLLAKTVENRAWSTTYRGDLLVHASRSWDDKALPDALWIELSEGVDLRVTDLSSRPADHPMGLVGLVEVVDVCNATVDQPHILCSCGRWANPGSYHWRLANPRPFATPIPCRGRLGLWTVPADLAAAVEREVASCASS